MDNQTLHLRGFSRDKVPPPKSVVQFPSLPVPPALEIGCGVGLHPIQWALGHPEQSIIAIEHTKTRFGRFQRRLENHLNIKNVIPVFDDAVSWISHRVPDESLAGVYLLYPNPYPKESQANKRWHRMPFMDWLLKTIVPGGFIQIATNEAFYAEEAALWLSDYWGLNSTAKKAVGAPFSGGGRTHFERKYLQRGEPCYDLLYSKP